MNHRLIVKVLQILFGIGFSTGVIFILFTNFCIVPFVIMTLSFLLSFLTSVYFNHLRISRLQELEAALIYDRECCWLYNWLMYQYDNNFDKNKYTRIEFINSLKEKLNVIHKQRNDKTCAIKGCLNDK